MHIQDAQITELNGGVLRAWGSQSVESAAVDLDATSQRKKNFTGVAVPPSLSVLGLNK